LKTVFALALFAVLASAFPPAAVTADPSVARPRAFTGATVIDGTGAPPVPSAAIVVDPNGLIRAVGPVAIPLEAERIDLTGKWIIPGLIDAHVHFFKSSSVFARPDIIDLRALKPYEAEIAETRRRIPDTFARYLAGGVIGAVDVGGPVWTFDVRAAARGNPNAPRVAASGPLLGTYSPPELAAVDPAIFHIETAEEARSAVRRLLAHDPDLVKIWFIFPGRFIDADMVWVRAAIDESHKGGVPVAAHATQLLVAKAMVAAGVDYLVHGIEDEPVDAAFVELAQARGVVYVPALLVSLRYRSVFGLTLRLGPLERRVGDPRAVRSLMELGDLPAAYRPRWVQKRPAPAVNAIAAANLVRLWRAGVPIAAGSDAGNIGTLHGASLHEELALMVEAGLPPLAVIEAASRGGARLMGRSEALGTIEVGKVADFVILDGDPLADIRNTQRIHRVVKGGAVLDPAALLEELARSE